MAFEWNVNVGNVLTAIILFVGFLTAHTQNVKRLANIETKLDMIYDWWKHNVFQSNKAHKDRD